MSNNAELRILKKAEKPVGGTLGFWEASFTMPRFGNDNVFVSSFAEVVLGNDNDFVSSFAEVMLGNGTGC